MFMMTSGGNNRDMTYLHNMARGTVEEIKFEIDFF